MYDRVTLEAPPDDNDVGYFGGFLWLAKHGKVRLLAGSHETLQREMEAGKECYLVILDRLNV